MILIILIAIGIVLIANEHKKQRQLENEENSLKTELQKDEAMIANLQSGHSIADVTNAGLYAKQPAKNQGPISDSIIELEKYIVESLDAGIKPSKIKELVVGTGWDISVVEVVMHKIMLSGDKLEEIEQFISKQIKKGTLDNQIAERLTNSHWSKEIVDLIISDVHKISKNTDSLNSYISKKIAEGKSHEEVHQILVSIGWNEHYIQRLLDRHQE